MDWDHHKRRLPVALKNFLQEDHYLLGVDANERSISFCLAKHLIPLYATYDVDCEYNRNGDAVKRLPSPTSSSTDDTNGKTIFPDIIIHHRGNHQSNLAVIEIKKQSNTDIERDRVKLQHLTSVEEGYEYKYTFGFHFTFDSSKLTNVVVYCEGQTKDDKSQELIDLLRIEGVFQ